MPGTSPGMTDMRFKRLSIAKSTCHRDRPSWIHSVNQPDLPGARPMFDGLLALDCRADVIVMLIVDEQFEPVLFGETVDETLSVLVGALWQQARHPGVKDAVAPARHHIDPATRHPASKARRGCPEHVR